MKEEWKDEAGDGGTPLNGNPDILRMRDGSIVHKGQAMDDYLALMTKYPNYRELTQSNGFVNWYLEQGPDVFALGQTFDAKDAMKLIDIFHESAGVQPVTVQ